jgi:catechol 2,3-dioxygenase-like lactoylglutathione lyase family enzyme
MTVELNHTIVAARDPKASAQFLADILGLPVGPPVARFTPRARSRPGHGRRSSAGRTPW